MIKNKLQSLLKKLKTEVKESSGKAREDKILNMINLIAITELNLKKNDISHFEEFEREILKYLKR
jgi:hypothetical protein